MLSVSESVSILVIDDNADVRKSLVFYLEDSGFVVHEACGGRHGIEMFEKHRPDLVFTDLMMPEFDGMAVVKEIARLSPNTPVVVISGNSSVGHAMESVRLGAWEYITKPILDMSIIDRVAVQMLDLAREKAIKLAHQDEPKETAPHPSKEEAKPQGTAETSATPVELQAEGIAHDFKNVLAVIVGNLYLAQVHLDESHKSIAPIKEAERAAENGNDLANKLSDLSVGKNSH
jgi:DNA-binding NtrC family response regulator